MTVLSTANYFFFETIYDFFGTLYAFGIDWRKFDGHELIMTYVNVRYFAPQIIRKVPWYKSALWKNTSNFLRSNKEYSENHGCLKFTFSPSMRTQSGLEG